MVRKKKNPSDTKRIARFRRAGDGSSTMEAVIWMPVFAVVLTILLNLSMMFYYESKMLRVAQDATRALSLGRLTETEAETYIQNQLSFIQANIAIDIAKVGDIAKAVVTTTADELLPFPVTFAPLENILVGVSTKYEIES